MTTLNSRDYKPTFEVLLSTFNGSRFIEPLVVSISNQRDVDLELIVRDDFSTDNTLKKLDALVAKYGLISRLIQGRHLGPTYSFLELLRSTSSNSYIAFCDQDDIWLPEKLKRSADKLEAISSEIPALYCSPLIYINSQNSITGRSAHNLQPDFANALVENIVTGCTVVINNAATLLVNVPQTIRLWDWWFYLVISAFGTVIFDEKSFIHYRRHSRNVIGGPNRNILLKTKDFFFGKKCFYSRQATLFLGSWGSRLSKEQLNLINELIASKSDFKKRIRLAGSSRLWRQTRMDNLFLKGLILRGKL